MEMITNGFFGLLLAFVILGILLYWEVRERRSSRAIGTRSGHSPVLRVFLRAIMPAAGILLMVQLIGIFELPLRVSTPILSALRTTGVILFLLGTILAIWARESLGIHWAHAADFQILPGQDLVTDGPYRYVRHPLYTAFLLVFLGTELIVGSVLVLLILPLSWLMVWQSRKEEEILRAAFRDAYRDYEQSTGMFFPRFLGSRQ